jgi:hypothetical protein
MPRNQECISFKGSGFSDTPYAKRRGVLQSFRLSPSCDGAGSRDLQNFKPTNVFRPGRGRFGAYDPSFVR